MMRFSRFANSFSRVVRIRVGRSSKPFSTLLILSFRSRMFLFMFSIVLFILSNCSVFSFIFSSFLAERSPSW